MTNPTQPQSAAPAQGQPDPTPGLAPETQQRLSRHGLSGDAIEQFLQGLDEDPDDEIASTLGLSPEGTPPLAEAGAVANAQPKAEASGEPKAEAKAEEPLTDEQIVATYGETVATKAAEAGVDINAWRTAYEAGEDTKAFREPMAKALGLPVDVVAQFEAGAARPTQETQQPQPLGEADTASLVEFVGGQQAFGQLNAWVLQNIPDDPSVAAFNAAVATGNMEAAKAWLSVVGLLHRQDAGHEPALIQGGDTYGEAGDVYHNYDELILDKTATDQRSGRPRYEVDAKWRKYVDSKVRRSTSLV